MKNIHRLVVHRVIKKINNAMIFGENPRFHVVANTRTRIKPGDTIEYERVASTFGRIRKRIK